MPGVTVELFEDVDGDGTFTSAGTTITDGTGKYEFTGLIPGDYYVEITPPTGYSVSPQDTSTTTDAFDSDIDPVTNQTPVVTLAPNEHNPTLDAGVYLTLPTAPENASLGDYVWYDADQDGIQDSSESGIAGVTVHLFSDLDGNGSIDTSGTSSPDYYASTTTDATGHYEFLNLAPSEDYQVQFVAPAGYTITAQDVTSDTDYIAGTGGEGDNDSDADPATGLTTTTTLDAGENDLSWDAGMYLDSGDQPASLGDYVWLDANQDGIQDSSESGIPGVMVELYSA